MKGAVRGLAVAALLAFGASSALAQTAQFPRDIDNIGTVVPEMGGMWSDGATLWVVDRRSQANRAIRAWNLATGARDAGKDFTNLASNTGLGVVGIWGNGATLWVTDHPDFGVGSAAARAYNLVTKARQPGLDIVGPTGAIWSDGVTLWSVSHDRNSLQAYTLNGGARDMAKDVTLASSNNQPSGLWGTATDLYVIETADDAIYLYNRGTRAFSRAQILTAAGGIIPRGIWGDGSGAGNIVWVADEHNDKIYSYWANTLARADHPVVSIEDASASEGAEFLDFRVRVQPVAQHDIFFDFQTQEITPGASGYYKERSDVGVRITPGSGTWGVRVPLSEGGRADTVDNPDQRLRVILSNLVGARFADGALTDAAIGVIVDNDDPPAPPTPAPGVDVRIVLWNIRNGGYTIRYNLHNLGDNRRFEHAYNQLPPGGYRTARVRTGGGGCPRALQPGGATLPLGITLPGSGGCGVEVDVLFPRHWPGVRFRNYTSHNNEITLTIPGPQIRISDRVVSESVRQFSVEPYLTEGAQGNVGYRCTVVDGTAQQGRDFNMTACNGIADRGTRGAVRFEMLPARRDNRLDNPDLNFQLVLDRLNNIGTGALATALTATVTITDDDDGGAEEGSHPIITIGDGIAGESDANINFPVRVSPTTGERIQWDFRTVDGAGAAAGTEFVAKSGRVTQNRNSNQWGVQVELSDAIRNDIYRTGRRQFTVVLSNPLHGFFPGGATEITAVGTIVDDDTAHAPHVSISGSATNLAGGNDLVFTVTATNTAQRDFTVPIAFSQSGSGAAVSMAVASALPTELTFTVGGAGAATITVATAPTVVSPETVSATLSGGGDYQDYFITGGAGSAEALVFSPDQPTLGVARAGADESVVEGSPLVFHLSSTVAPALQDLTVGVELTNADDYTTNPPTAVTIATGQTSATYSVATAADTTYEADGAATLTIQPAGMAVTYNIRPDAASATVTVTDDDTPTVEIAFATGTATTQTVTEGDPAEYTLTASATPYQDLTVAIEVSQEGNVFGDNLIHEDDLGERTVVIPSGMTTATYTVRSVENTRDDYQRAASITLRGAFTGTHTEDDYFISSILADLVLGLRVDDDDDPPTVSVQAGTGAEGGSIDVLVSLSAVSGRTVTVEYTTADGSATAPDDYTATSGTLTFPPRDPRAIFAVRIANDEEDEEAETFDILISNPDGATLGVDSASGTILVLPAVRLQAAAAATAVTEGGEAVFIVTIPNPVSGGLEVPVIVGQTGNWTETGERIVHFAAGQREARVTVATVDDNTDEANGIVDMTIGALPSSHSGQGRYAFVDMTDNEQPPVFTVAPSGGPEGEVAVFAVRLMPFAGERDGQVTEFATSVSYDVVAEGNDTAVAGEDFETDRGFLLFAAGEELKEVRVTLGEDDNEEEETFTFKIFDPVGATFAGGSLDAVSVQGTVQELPGLSITADAATVAESGAAVYTIGLSQLLETATVVPVAISATGNVLSGPSGGAPGTVTIPAGGSEVQLRVALDNDERDEADGAVTATISLPAGREEEFLLRGPPSSTVTVTDDDNEPTISAHAPARHAIEGSRPLLFPVRLSGASERVITVRYTTEAETPEGAEAATATADLDYRPETGTLTFAPNRTEQAVEVLTLRDEIDDPDETVFLTISNPTFATLGVARVSGLIREGLDDASARALNEAILPYIAAAVSDQTTRAVRDRIKDAFAGNDAGRFSARGLVGGQIEQAGIFRHSREHPQGRESGNPDKESSGVSATTLPGAATADALAHPDASGLYPVWTEDTTIAWSDRRLNWREWNPLNRRVSDMAFTTALSERGGEDGTREGLTLWGRGYYSDIAPNEGPISFQGDVTGGMIGVDALLDDTLFGLGINHARADIRWDNTDFTGAHETELTGIHPYLGWTWGEGTHFWTTLGYEWGDTVITEDERPELCDFCDFNVELQTAALGAWNRLHERGVMGGELQLAFIGDTAFTRLKQTSVDTVSTRTGWLRAGLELDYNRALRGDGAFGGTMELTWRHDYGDARVGSGAEVGGGFDLDAPKLGLRFDVHARTLLTHADGGDEWGVHGTVTWAVATDGRLLSVSFRPEWGATGDAQQRLWDGGFATTRHSREYPQGHTSGNPDKESASLWTPASLATPGMTAEAMRLRYHLELEYGIPLFRDEDLLTLFARSNLQNAGDDLGIGAAFKLGPYFTTGYEAATYSRSGAESDTDHRAYLKYEIGF